MGRVNVNGIELYYESQGTGPAVLLVPGLGADTRLFGGVIGPLAGTCQVIAFDPRGAGRSEKPPGPYTVEQMANDAHGLLDVLGIEHAVVVGYSMGGRIALSLALDHPTARSSAGPRRHQCQRAAEPHPEPPVAGVGGSKPAPGARRQPATVGLGVPTPGVRCLRCHCPPGRDRRSHSRPAWPP